MKKKIYLYKLKDKYSDINITENNINKIKNQSLEEKILLTLKTFGLIILLLLGPSFLLMMFGNNLESSSLIMKTIISLFADIVILGILCFIYRDTLIKDFKNFFNKNIFNNLEIAFKYWLAGFGVMVISNLIISFITNGGIAANEQNVRELIDLVPLYMLFNVSIYAPFTEELIFRKSIRDFVSNKWGYVLTSGLIFGGLHVVISITSAIDLLYLIPYCSLGIAFALLYHKTNNIYSSVSMHMLHNTMAILLYLI